MIRVASVAIITVFCASICFGDIQPITSDETISTESPISVSLKVDPTYEKSIYLTMNETVMIQVEGQTQFLRAILVDIILSPSQRECTECFSLRLQTRAVSNGTSFIYHEADSFILPNTPKTTLYIPFQKDPTAHPAPNKLYTQKLTMFHNLPILLTVKPVPELCARAPGLPIRPYSSTGYIQFHRRSKIQQGHPQSWMQW